jgi:lipopolysaccharide transport system ATP-binding protein
MYVRLAFAVAAHLEPEILIVDEVLAVGDAEFQKKCLGKMKDVAGHGRTVLFVSHNMAAISTLCSRGILLAGGQLVYAGSSGDVIQKYSGLVSEEYDVEFAVDLKKPSITRVMVDQEYLMQRHLKIAIYYESPVPLQTPIGGVILSTANGDPVWGSNGRFHASVSETKEFTIGLLTCEALDLPLLPGQYSVSIWLSDWHTDHDAKIDQIRVTIGDERFDPLRPPLSVVGYIDWPASWKSIAC